MDLQQLPSFSFERPWEQLWPENSGSHTVRIFLSISSGQSKFILALDLG